MERTRSQLETEIQNLEEEKNRVIEEAFVRAESEMKAVHENLAGVCAFYPLVWMWICVLSVHVSVYMSFFLFSFQVYG